MSMITQSLVSLNSGEPNRLTSSVRFLHERGNLIVLAMHHVQKHYVSARREWGIFFVRIGCRLIITWKGTPPLPSDTPATQLNFENSQSGPVTHQHHLGDNLLRYELPLHHPAEVGLLSQVPTSFSSFGLLPPSGDGGQRCLHSRVS
jgi:hypothetical protein